MPVTDVDSDFFDMGGHSLLAARLISDARADIWCRRCRSSRFLDERQDRRRTRRTNRCRKRSSGTDEFTSDPPLHFIFSDQAIGDEPETLHGAVGYRAAGTRADPRTARRAVRPIRDHRTACQPDSFRRSATGSRMVRLHLVGFSFGGLLAYEVARQAVHAGQHVNWLSILDAARTVDGAIAAGAFHAAMATSPDTQTTRA